MRAILYSASGDGHAPDSGAADNVGMVPRKGGFLSRMLDPGACRPGSPRPTSTSTPASSPARVPRRLNWYRNIDRNWELLAPFAGARVTVPALYVAGDRDLVVSSAAWTSSSRT